MSKELFERKCCSLLNLVHYFVEQLDTFHYAHKVDEPPLMQQRLRWKPICINVFGC